MSTRSAGYVVAPVATRVRHSVAERGAVRTLAALCSWGARYVGGRAALRVAPGAGGTFAFDGRPRAYLRHPHNHTWLDERAVELPLAFDQLEGHRGGRVLEIGNVLSHYRAVEHPIVDRYERGAGVCNLDVLAVRAGEPLDLILSVSTLEHVGWDEHPRDPGRAVAAIAHLRGLLAPGGMLWATLPVGYNPALDAAVREGSAGFDEVRALARTGPGMRWTQVDPGEAWGLAYDRLLYRARALLVCSAHVR